MKIQLESVIPLGRRKKEYIEMFNLNNEDLNTRILDCGGGPSSFNAELNREGISIVSIDPIYQFKRSQIQERIDDTFENMMQQAEKNKNLFIWKHISSVTELRELRRTAMSIFLKDYEEGLEQGRYIYAMLPQLPFEDNSFDLALCSHFLFLYSDNLTYEFHVQAIEEMLRVSSEIRIFPIVDLNANISPYLADIVKEFEIRGYKTTIENTQYEFQKGANQFLKITID